MTPLTTIDYPNHLSAVIYCQGCGWQCSYCHNPEMIDCKKPGCIEWHEILAFLRSRQGLLDAVVFSGGEPLMQAGLYEAISEVKALGFKIGLHTGGAVAKRFKQVLPLVDWVGFDVKGLLQVADAIMGIKGAAKANWQGLEILLESGVDYQCRTTVHWSLTSPRQLKELASQLAAKGVANYSVQIARNGNTLDANLPANHIARESELNLKSQLSNQFKAFAWVNS
jgi:pyruvate formate lyase activating enzyme